MRVLEPRVDAEQRGAHAPRSHSQLLRQRHRLLQLIKRANCFQIVAGGVRGRQYRPVAGGPAVAEQRGDELGDVLRRADQAVRAQRFESPGKRNGAARKEAVGVLQGGEKSAGYPSPTSLMRPAAMSGARRAR